MIIRENRRLEVVYKQVIAGSSNENITNGGGEIYVFCYVISGSPSLTFMTVRTEAGIDAPFLTSLSKTVPPFDGLKLYSEGQVKVTTGGSGTFRFTTMRIY